MPEDLGGPLSKCPTLRPLNIKKIYPMQLHLNARPARIRMLYGCLSRKFSDATTCLRCFGPLKHNPLSLPSNSPRLSIRKEKTIRKLHYRFVEVYGFDNESEYAYKDIGYNLKKEELVFHWNEEGIKNVGYITRGEDYDYTVYTTLDDLLEHLGEFHTENKELWLAQHN